MGDGYQHNIFEKLDYLLVVLIKDIPRSEFKCCRENEEKDILQVYCMQGRVYNTPHTMCTDCDEDW